MIKNIVLISFLILIFPFSSFSFSSYSIQDLDAFRFVGPGKVGKSDSGIFYPPYQKIVDELVLLEQSYPNFSELINIGKTEDGVDTFGIFIRNGSKTTKKIILITGATHGNEFLNIANRLPEAFLNEDIKEFYDFYKRGGAFFIIPIVNPYGYSNRVRYNANNVDLNRDFTNVITGFERFTQKESQNYADAVEELIDNTNANLKIAMDYHCCYRGALLFPWSYTRNPIPSNDRLELNQMGELLKDQLPNTQYGAVEEILWYGPDGTTMDYLYGKFGTLSMAYEGRHLEEEKYLEKHINWWKDIVTQY